jgi:hypothetical protein
MSGERARFSGPARLLRGAILGGTCLVLTEIGHTAAGGGHLDVSTGLAALVALALGTAWAQRRRSVVRLTLFIAAVQLLLHVLMVMSGAHASHHVPLLPGTSMLIAHALAAVAMALVLNFGEATLQQWITFLAALAGPSLALPVITTAAPAMAIRTRAAIGTTSIIDRHQPRRGPPSS